MEKQSTSRKQFFKQVGAGLLGGLALVGLGTRAGSQRGGRAVTQAEAGSIPVSRDRRVRSYQSEDRV